MMILKNKLCGSAARLGRGFQTRPLLKGRGSVIRNSFLEYRTKQATFVARRNDWYALFATNKAKHILKRHFRAPVVTQLIVKV